MQEFDFGNCGGCVEAREAVRFFTEAWRQLDNDKDFPSDEDRARYRERYASESRAGRQIPKPGGGVYVSADDFEMTMVELILTLNDEFATTIETRAARLQRIFNLCGGMTLGGAVMLEDQLCPVTTCASLGEILGIRREFIDPGR